MHAWAQLRMTTGMYTQARGLLPPRVPQFGDLRFSRVLFLVTNVTIFSKHFLLISGHSGHLGTIRPDAQPFFRKPDAMATSAQASSCEWKPVWNGKPEKYFIPGKMFFFRNGKKERKTIAVVCVYACHDAVSSPFHEYQSLLDLIRCSHASWWKCWSCKGLVDAPKGKVF